RGARRLGAGRPGAQPVRAPALRRSAGARLPHGQGHRGAAGSLRPRPLHRHVDSAYGPGWKRETSIVFRNPTGVFCYSFWPTRDASLPGRPARPVGDGSAYRIEVQGPGVTPNLAVVVGEPGRWKPDDTAKAALEERLKARQLELSQGDRFCPSQT